MSESRFPRVKSFLDAVLPGVGFLALYVGLVFVVFTAIDTVVKTKANARDVVEHEQRIAALEAQARQQAAKTNLGQDAFSLRP